MTGDRCHQEKGADIPVAESQIQHFSKGPMLRLACLFAPLYQRQRQHGQPMPQDSYRKVVEGLAAQAAEVEALDLILLLSGRVGMSSTASLLQEPRASLAVTPSGSSALGKCHSSPSLL